MTDSLTHQLALQLARPVDAASRARAVLHWLDWIGCAASGADSPAVQAIARATLLPGTAATEPALVGLAHDPQQAVCMDAAAACVEEMDDLHREAVLHPGPVVLPPLAWLVRRQGLHAASALDAVVRGYEAMIRIGRAAGRAHYRWWHPTATVGVFGSAAACSSALGLSVPQTVWALGNAGTQAAGLWQVRMEPVMSKPLHAGHAAWNGLRAASLAQAGFTGPACILEGERGFFAAMCPDARVDDWMATSHDWLIHQTSFKPWPACRHTHATIDCVLALRERLGHESLVFRECTIETFSDALALCDKPRPGTRTEAKFSLQYLVAATARWGAPTQAFFAPAHLHDPSLQQAAARVTPRVSAEFEDCYPGHFGARVRMTLDDGRQIEHAVIDSLGDPERALDPGQVFDKAHRLMSEAAVSRTRIDQVLNAASDLIDRCERGDALLEPFPAALVQPLRP